MDEVHQDEQRERAVDEGVFEKADIGKAQHDARMASVVMQTRCSTRANLPPMRAVM